MVWCRLALFVLVWLAAVPVTGAPAVEVASGLVPGGAFVGRPDGPGSPARLGETRLPALAGRGFSLGGVTGAVPGVAGASLPFSPGQGGLAVGGYVAVGRPGTQFSSSLRSDGTWTRADLSAAVDGGVLGPDSTALVSLGTTWLRPQGFSLNPAQPAAIAPESYRDGRDFNLSVRLMHDVTPSLSVGGVAQASRIDGDDHAPASALMLGAGFGYRF